MAGKSHQPQASNCHAETLRQRLETVSVLGNSSTSRRLGERRRLNASNVQCNEQALSCDAAPSNPAVANSKEIVSRPKSVPLTGPKVLLDVDRAPLTFDLTNGVRHGALNANSKGSNQGENRVVMPPGAFGSWSRNKSTNKNISTGYLNGWARSTEHRENQPTQQPTARCSLSMDCIEFTTVNKATNSSSGSDTSALEPRCEHQFRRGSPATPQRGWQTLPDAHTREEVSECMGLPELHPKPQRPGLRM